MVKKSIYLAALFILVISLSGCQRAGQPDVPSTGGSTSQPEVRSTNAPTIPPAKTATFSATATPGFGSIQVSTIDGMPMVYVPSGTFEMGGYQGDVDLDAYWIDQTEVTNAMFAKFVDALGYVTDAEKNGGSYEYIPSDEKGDYYQRVEGVSWDHPQGKNSTGIGFENHPVVHVSWNDAAAYCSWAERRLPTEAEWEKAASWNERTGEKYRYPWGRMFDGTLINYCDQNCSVVWASNQSDDGYAETAPVGSYPKGASPYGALDMAGNVIEWVLDWYGPIYYKDELVSNPKGPNSGKERVLRGGGWFTDASYTMTDTRISSDPTRPTYYAGFRCADTP